MAIADEQINLIFNMKGQESINSLTAAIQTQEKELKDLKVALDQGDISLGEFLNQSQATAAGLQTMNSAMQTVRGDFSAGGRGLLGASYAFQDFTSQIRNGIGPAMASIQNNIPQILMGTGMSNPMIAAISGISVAIGLIAPAIAKAFGSDSQEDIEATKKKMEELDEQIKKTHEDFLKMTQAPTAPEQEQAENLKAILATRPNAELMKQALMKMMPDTSLTDEQIKAQADLDTVRFNFFKEEKDARMKDRIRELTEQRAAFRAQDALQRAQIAEETIKQAQVAGPAGAAAMEKIQAAIAGGKVPGALGREISGIGAEALRASDAADEAFNQGNAEWRNARQKQRAKQKERAAAEKAVAEAEQDARAAVHEIEEAERREAEKANREAEANRRKGRQAAAHDIREQARGEGEKLDDMSRLMNRNTELMIERAKEQGAQPAFIEALQRQNRALQWEIGNMKTANERMTHRQLEAVQGGGSDW
jgi:hypothetical protein